jgi:hypothetical protein
MTTDADIHSEYARILDGLRAQAKRLAVADTLRAAARRETGLLLRQSAKLAEGHREFGITDEDAADITGLQPEAFAAARADRPAGNDSGHWSQMTDAALAAAYIAYNYSHLHVEAELHARYPQVAALHDATTYLIRQHREDQPGSVMNWLDGPPAPGATELRGLYRAHVQAIADGRPAV